MQVLSEMIPGVKSVYNNLLMAFLPLAFDIRANFDSAFTEATSIAQFLLSPPNVLPVDLLYDDMIMVSDVVEIIMEEINEIHEAPPVTIEVVEKALKKNGVNASQLVEDVVNEAVAQIDAKKNEFKNKVLTGEGDVDSIIQESQDIDQAFDKIKKSSISRIKEIFSNNKKNVASYCEKLASGISI